MLTMLGIWAGTVTRKPSDLIRFGFTAGGKTKKRGEEEEEPRLSRVIVGRERKIDSLLYKITLTLGGSKDEKKKKKKRKINLTIRSVS